MFEVCLFFSNGKAEHALIDYPINDNLIDILYGLQDELGCEVFSIRYVDIEEMC